MARRASRPLRLWRLALLLAAALVPCLTRTAEYVPNGESGGFIRLAADEHGGADTFSVSLARKDGAPAAAAGAIRPQTLLCQRDRGGWLIYAGGWPEDLDGTYDLLVRCGAADDARIIRLPDAIRRRTRRMDVALLLDDSRSMRTTDPQRLRVAAARLFAQMAALRGNIETLTIVAFNRRAHLLLPPTPPGDSAAVDAALERLEASGATDLDSAFALAYEQLDRLPPSHKTAVVLSDGRDEPGHYTFGHRRFSARQWPVHTIGLSDDIDEQCLQMIAASTGGAYHRAHSTEALARIFRDIAAALQSGVTVGEWHLDGGDEAAFPVDDTLRLLSLALLDRTEARSACALQAPDGTSHALSSTWATDAFADLFAPAAGNWQVKGIAGKALLSVTGVSSLELVPFPVVRPAETNKPMPVTAFVMEGSQLLKPVRIVAQLPDGTAVTLHDDGLNADGAAADGIYGAYLSLKTPEQIRLSLTATGQTAGGQAFQRFTYRELEAVIHAVPITGATTRIIPPATLPGAISRGPAAYPLPRPADTAAPPAPAKPQTEYAFAGHGRAAPLATIAHEPQLPVPNAVTPAEILLPLDAEVPPEPPEEEIESPAQSVEQAEVPEEEQASEPVAEEGAPSGTPADDAPSPAASAGDAQPARLPVNLWKIVLLIAAIIFLCWMIWRWFTRPSMAVSRMASFFLVSLLLHGILAILLMDLLVQTRVITVEQISPQLAISLQAIESSLGIQLTPPGPAVPLAAQSAGATEVARATMQAKSTLPQTIEPSRPATDEPSTMRAILEPDIPDPDHAGMTPVAAPETPAPPPTPEAPTETLEAVRPEAVAETPPPQQEPEPVTLGRAVAETPRQPLPPAPTAMPRQMDKPQPSRVAVTTPRTAAASRPITSVTMIERPELPASPSSAAEPDAPVLPEPIKVQTAEQTPETPTPKSLPRAPAREIVASQAPDLTTAPLRPTTDASASVTHATPQTAHGAPVKAVSTSIAGTADAPSLPAAPTVTAATPEPVQPLAVAGSDTAPAAPAERPQPVQLARTTSAPQAAVPQQTQGLASVPPLPTVGGSPAAASVTHATPQPALGAPVKTVPTSIAGTTVAPSLPAAPTVTTATPEPVQPLAVAGTDTAPAAEAERPQPVQLARTTSAPQATVPQQAQDLASVPLRPAAGGGSAAPASVTHATPQAARSAPVKAVPTSIAATANAPSLPAAPTVKTATPEPVQPLAVADADTAPATPAERPQPVQLARTTSAPHATVPQQAQGLASVPLRPAAGGSAAPASVTHATPQPARGAPVKTVPTSIAATADTPSLPAAPTVAAATPEPVQPLAVAGADTAPAAAAERPQPVQLARTAGAPQATVPQQAQGLASVPLRPVAGGSAAPASVTHATPQPARGTPVKSAPTSIAATGALPRLPNAPLPGAESLAPAPVAIPAVAEAAAGPALSQGPSGIWLPRPEHGLARAERTSQSPGPRPQPTAVSPSPPLPEMALPSVAAPQQAGTLAPMRDAPLAFQIGSGSEVSHRVTIGLAQYGGDWDWARHAMTFLGHQLRERTRMAINAGDRVVRLDSPDLARLPFVYMTGHKDFRLSDAEVANLRAYLLGGGYLWADDSTHFNDETFDTAFRRELARILPEAPLERLDMTFEGFRTGYDLTRGYKGYAIPPGDKYRLDYIEGARLGDRVAVVYTRNDYGDGLNIDEYTHPLHTSLTDLSPAEMQEGAVRMGINLTLYFLTHGKGEATFIDRTAATLRQRPETDAAKEPAGTARPLPLFAAGAAWQHEDWSDAGQLNLADATARLNFTVGAQRKCALSQQQEPPVEVTAGDIVAIRVRSGLRGGARVALAFTVAERYFESRPVYIKPGENLALFPCGEATFKTEAGGWAYRDQLPARAAIQRITLLVYSPTPGELHLSHPRIIRAGQQE